ncbi:MAG: transposase [bacterium]|nr:transposase [bacterium]
MENKKKHPSFQLLALITTPKLAGKAERIFRKNALPIQYRLNAEGTASSEIMDMLGLGSIDKCIMASIVSKQLGDTVLGRLRTELRLGSVNSGVAFTVPLNGMSNLVLHMLTQNSGEEDAHGAGKDGNNMAGAKYALIAAVVNIGFGGDVMDAARAAGAGGGTLIHSRWIGNDEVTALWGLSVQDEKEIVLILSESDLRLPIMSAISEKCGMQSEAKGLVVSLPIDSVMGM